MFEPWYNHEGQPSVGASLSTKLTRNFAQSVTLWTPHKCWQSVPGTHDGHEINNLTPQKDGNDSCNPLSIKTGLRNNHNTKTHSNKATHFPGKHYTLGDGKKEKSCDDAIRTRHQSGPRTGKWLSSEPHPQPFRIASVLELGLPVAIGFIWSMFTCCRQ